MSIKVFYRPNAKLTLELEIKDLQGLFEELGPLQEILGEADRLGIADLEFVTVSLSILFPASSRTQTTFFLSPRSIPIVILFIAGSPLFLQHNDCVDLEHDCIIAREESQPSHLT